MFSHDRCETKIAVFNNNIHIRHFANKPQNAHTGTTAYTFGISTHLKGCPKGIIEGFLVRNYCEINFN